jgi:hypothetical protein
VNVVSWLEKVKNPWARRLGRPKGRMELTLTIEVPVGQELLSITLYSDTFLTRFSRKTAKQLYKMALPDTVT